MTGKGQMNHRTLSATYCMYTQAKVAIPLHTLFILLFRFQFLIRFPIPVLLSSVLWCCWLGGRKGIQPVKTWVMSDDMLAWLSVWSEVQMICIWSGWCHCRPVISASENPEWFILLVPAYPGSPGKRPLNDCVCVCVSYSCPILQQLTFYSNSIPVHSLLYHSSFTSS